jgi:hypothetical protein
MKQLAFQREGLQTPPTDTQMYSHVKDMFYWVTKVIGGAAYAGRKQYMAPSVGVCMGDDDDVV